jgi:nicotinamide phosphoribosyltransferase
LWRRVVDEYGGRMPIKVSAMPEGSVVYPNEPVVVIENVPDGFGELAAWFESTFLKIWSSSELVTQLAHWFEYNREMVLKVYGDTIPSEQVDFLAGLMLHNFGCRAGMTPQESEWMGSDALYIFSGTDTFSGAYQAWKNAGEIPGIAMSVFALAHRNVQGFEKENDCYRAIYDASKPGDIVSTVGDCYSWYDATEQYLLPLAIESNESGVNKIIVDRPDSGNPLEQVLWLCKLAHKNGLSTTEVIDGKEWRFPKTLKFIEGDGMTFAAMKEINEVLMAHGFPPFAWGLYGQGGGMRNDLSRDNLSAKYALCAIGNGYQPVCKFSDTLEKTTLPGPLKVKRDWDSLQQHETIAFTTEEGNDALVVYFDGSDLDTPFKVPFEDDFNTIKERIKKQMRKMPRTMKWDNGQNYPITDAVHAKRIELLKKYAPKKLAQNY